MKNTNYKELDKTVKDLTKEIYEDVMASVLNRCKNRLSSNEDNLYVIRSVLMSVAVTVLIRHTSFVKKMDGDFRARSSIKDIKQSIKKFWLEHIGEEF